MKTKITNLAAFAVIGLLLTHGILSAAPNKHNADVCVYGE